MTAGTRLGPYEVMSVLGAGGMGEVYKAKDTRLDRVVAIKVLSSAFSSSQDLRDRFQREAKAIASLNHPHICTLHDVGQHEGADYLVMECLAGETLEERLRRGALPLDDAVSIAAQIADALATAHRAGIIHRDLKPGNIMLTKSGAKLLDFGLAKTAAPVQAGGMSMLVTTPPALTVQGTLLGTFHYMAPEQLEGAEADHRTDIFAFGAILFEMITRRKAFEGQSPASVMAAILERNPPAVSSLRPFVPPSFAALVEKCLEKRPDDRWQSAADLSFALARMIEPAAPTNQTTPSARAAISRRTWMAGVAVVALCAAITAAAIWTRQAPVAERSIKRFTIQLPSSVQFRDLGQGVMALSPNGQHLVYSATDNQSFFVRDFHAGETRVLEGTQGLRPIQPVFSPDGRDIAFVTGRPFPSIQKIPVAGGVPAVLYRLQPDAPFGAILGFTWSADGLLASHGRHIVAIPATGGSPQVVVTLAPDEYAYNPSLLPGGDGILYTRAKGTAEDRWHTAEIVLQRPGEEPEVLLGGGSDARYVRTGHIVYSVGGVLHARAFDARQQKFTSEPVAILAGVRRNTAGANAVTHFAFGDDGSMAYLAGPRAVAAGAQNDVVFAGPAGRVDRLGLPPGRYRDVRISPDGRWVALTATESAERHIWIQDLMGERAFRRLTFEGKQNAFPLWSPDSTRLTFQSDRGGDQALYSQRIDGSAGAARLTTPAPGESHTPQSWNPQGKILLVNVTKDASHELWAWSDDAAEMRPVAGVKSGIRLNAAFSADGRWVSYTSTELRPSQLFVQPFPATGAKYQVSRIPDDGHHGVWSADGQRLYFVPSPSRFGYVPVSTKNNSFQFGAFVELFAGFTEGNAPSDHRTYDVLPDGRLAGVMDAVTPLDERSNAVVGQQINIVLNWFEELKILAPVP